MAKLMTGFMTFISLESCSSEIMLAKAAEKDIPISMKFRIDVERRRLIQNPIPAEASSIPAMIPTRLPVVRTRRSTLPVTKPVAAPISTGRNTRNSTTATGVTRNGTLQFTLLPPQNVITRHYEEKLAELELSTERQQIQKYLEQQASNAPCAPM